MNCRDGSALSETRWNLESGALVSCTAEGTLVETTELCIETLKYMRKCQHEAATKTWCRIKLASW